MDGEKIRQQKRFSICTNGTSNDDGDDGPVRQGS